MAVLIETSELRKTFGPINAVDGISLNVNKGEVLGFLGPNGAGKSTTMKMIAGFLQPDSGTARICGHDILDAPIEAKEKLGYLPEGAPSYGEMTPVSFLRFISAIRGSVGPEIQREVDAVTEKTGLRDVLGQSIDTLSKGYKRRVGLAQAILHDPDVLILDEPTDGLDPNQKHHVRELIAAMAESKAIIVSTHILEEVEAVCSRAIIIDYGRIVADGTAEELQARVPYHNAVAISARQESEELIRKDLEAAGGVAKVETVSQKNGSVRLRVIAKNGAVIAADIAALIKEKSLPVEEIYVERGKLEDVFRQITTAEKGSRGTGEDA